MASRRHRQRGSSSSSTLKRLVGLLGLITLTWSGATAATSIDPMAKAEARMQSALRMDGMPGGVVLNKTLTIIGYDFYQYFAKAWRTRENTDHYSLVVVERPNAMRGSEVWIEHRNRRIFTTRVSPRRSAVRDVSERAVELVYQAVVDAEMQQALFPDPDLAKEELQ
jgi:curli production assembly/transport component CsgE